MSYMVEFSKSLFIIWLFSIFLGPPYVFDPILAIAILGKCYFQDDP